MYAPRASASTSSGCAYSRSIRSRARRSRARSRRCCAAAGVLVTSRSCHVPFPTSMATATLTMHDPAIHARHSWRVDRAVAEEWIRQHVEPTGAIETTHERPWATVMRVPVAGGVIWFKACAPVEAFEPRLTAELYARWPDRVTEVLAIDETRHWLLLGDAGMAV